MVTAYQISKYMLCFCQKHGDSLSNLKLQKLLYYAQAWYLALYNKPLFGDRIEAWVHGPVVPRVYGRFKAWLWQPIEPTPNPDPLTKRTKDHVQEILEVYGGLSAFQLERLTHQEEPWRKARKGLAPDEPSREAISHEDMKSFYRAMLDGSD